MHYKKILLRSFVIFFLGYLTGCSKQNENPPLAITSIHPSSGTYGTQDTLSGSGFSIIAGENIIYFNGVEAQSQSISSTQLVARVPEGAGTGPVKIMSNNNSAEGPVFEYIPTAVVSTLAGNGLFGSQDGTGTGAEFNHPRGISISADGDIYVCDEAGNTIRKITPGGIVTTIAGDGIAGFVNGTAGNAEFNGPVDLAWLPSNSLFPGDSDYLVIADSKNNVLRSINLVSSRVTTWAGSNGGYSDGDLSSVQFNFPDGLAFHESSGFLFISDYLNNRIRLYHNNYIGTVAGNSTIALQDGYSTQASFAGPAGIAADDAGNLYVADWYNHAIRKMDIYLQVTTLAGTGQPGYVDGAGNAAQFNTPSDVALYNHDTQLLVADGFNHRIRIIDLSDNTVSTLAGSGRAGFKDGKGDIAEFNGPAGIAAADSMIYITDYFNNRIRKITME